MKNHTVIIIKLLAKILAVVFVLMAVSLLVFNLLQRKIQTVASANDQAMLEQEQILLNQQILSLQESLRLASNTKQDFMAIADRQKKNSSQAKAKEAEGAYVLFEKTEIAIQDLLDYANEIYQNNIQLIGHYHQPERLDYEIKRSELLLSKKNNEDNLSEIDELKINFDSNLVLNFLFRRTSAEQMEDDLPFLLANQAAGQNPYRTETNYSSIEMMTYMLRSPVSYIFFLFSTIPAALLLTSQFSSGRMNTFFQMNTRQKIAKICILLNIGFWLITFLLICLMVFCSGLLQKGVGNGGQLLYLADKTIITASEFIQQRLFSFSLFSLQMTLLFTFLGIKLSSIRIIQLVSGFIIIIHYTISNLQIIHKSFSGFNPLAFLNMNFDVLPLRNINYIYLLSTIAVLIFFIRQYFIKYEDR